jgi:molecular chaperone GrpE
VIEHDGADEPRSAGPVGAGDPPHPPVAKASSGVGPPTPPPAEGADQVEQDFEALLADAHKEKDEYLELAKRTQADFENYRKRMTADVQAASLRGKVELARELIDPVDNLERALETAGIDPDLEDPLRTNAGGDAGEPLDGFAQGVLFVFLGLRETLRRHGIEAVNPKGEPFDPNWHEALSMKPAEGGPVDVVVEVMQKGYRLNDQLIRPARVVVSK